MKEEKFKIDERYSICIDEDGIWLVVEIIGVGGGLHKYICPSPDKDDAILIGEVLAQAIRRVLNMERTPASYNAISTCGPILPEPVKVLLKEVLMTSEAFELLGSAADTGDRQLGS